MKAPPVYCSSTHNELKILLHNTRSLISHIDEVKVLFTENNPDIFAITETFLDSNVDDNSDYDRLLTARLYWSDLDRRIIQEVL